MGEAFSKTKKVLPPICGWPGIFVFSDERKKSEDSDGAAEQHCYVCCFRSIIVIPRYPMIEEALLSAGPFAPVLLPCSSVVVEGRGLGFHFFG